MPTLHCYRNGKKVQTIVGADINAIKAEVAKAAVPGFVRAFKLESVAATLLSQPKQSALLVAVLAYLGWSSRQMALA